MIDSDTQASTARSARRWGVGAALVAAGLAGGVVLASTVSANAATSTPSPSTSSGATWKSGQAAPLNPGDPSKPQRSDETLLTGDTAAKVRAAALAKYPGATIERVETDSDGVYEAHLVTTDGTHLAVEVDTSFTVTGTETGGGAGGGHGGGNGVDPDPNDDDGPGTSNPGGSAPGTSGSSASASPSTTG